jgi:photosystem II stability/assembly factor-like uncharacterized protein
MMRLLKPLFTLAFLLLSISWGNSQTFLETERNKPAPSFQELQRRLDEYGRQADAKKAKGWKWLKRWEHFETQRMNPDGSLMDMGEYVLAAQAVAEQKSAAAKVSANGWFPLGPNDYAVPDYPGWEPGIGRINCVAFHPTIATTYWVGVAQGGVWKTVDDGQSWTPLTDNMPMLRVSDIAVNPANPNEIYLAVGDMAYFGAGLTMDDRKRHTHYGLGVYKTTDGGSTWNPTGLSFLQTDFDFSLTCRIYIHPTNTTHLVAAGTKGIWTSANSGATWTHTKDSLVWDMERDPVNPQVLYASTGYRSTINRGSASIIKSTDFGATWNVLPTGITPANGIERIELAVSPSDPNYVYALCAGMDAGFAGMYRSTNAGASWTLQSTTPNILEWWDGNGFGGQGWYDLAIIVNPNDRNTVYTGGINMWGTTDGGVTWEGCSYWVNDYGPSLHADQHQFSYNPLNQKYYVCNDGGLYATSSIQIGSWLDAMNSPGYTWPTTWSKLSSGMQVTSFYRCSTTPAASGNLIAGAQDNGTYFYDGVTWHNLFGGDGMECILHPTDPMTLYASSQYGNLIASNDGGATGYGISVGEIGEWTTPFLLLPNTPNIMYAAYGNVYKSNDGGFTWDPISNFPINAGLGQPNISSALAVSTQDPNYIYVAKRFYHSYGEPSALWVTTNGGNSWVDRTAGLPDSLYLTHITVDSDQPATAWVTVGGFVPGVKVFKTTNAGLTWHNKSLNLPNVQTNCLMHDRMHNHNPIYVGMDVGVYYFNDTLSAWQLYATDLPNVVVSDLELDAPNSQIVAATFGRGLWGVSLKDQVIVGNGPSGSNLLTMQVVPNPNQGAFDLVLEGKSTEGLTLDIIDIMGRIVHTEVIPPFATQHRQVVATKLSPGCYFARASREGNRWVKRFVVE